MANEHLKAMVDALIDGNNEQAQVSFHSYLTGRMKDQLNPQDPAATAEPADKTDKKEEKK